jgi:hypothetical protein
MKRTKKKVEEVEYDEHEDIEELKYPCANCGFENDGEFLCKCGNVLCESCAIDDCPKCRGEYDDEPLTFWVNKEW